MVDPATSIEELDVVAVDQVPPEESPVDVLLSLVDETPVDPESRETPLASQIDSDALATLYEMSSDEWRLEAIVWEHPTVFTPEAIKVYESVETRR